MCDVVCVCVQAARLEATQVAQEVRRHLRYVVLQNHLPAESSRIHADVSWRSWCVVARCVVGNECIQVWNAESSDVVTDVVAQNRFPSVDVSVPASTTFAIVFAISGTKLALLGFDG